MTEVQDGGQKSKAPALTEQTRAALVHLHKLWREKWKVEADVDPMEAVERFGGQIEAAGLKLEPYVKVRLLVARILLEHKVNNTDFGSFRFGFRSISADIVDPDKGGLDIALEKNEVVDVALLEEAILHYLKLVQATSGEQKEYVEASFVLWQHKPERLREFVEVMRRYQTLDFEMAPELAKFILGNEAGKIPQATHLRPKAWKVITDHLNDLEEVERKIVWKNMVVLLDTKHPLEIVVAQMLKKLTSPISH